jgi:hypothetical protein
MLGDSQGYCRQVHCRHPHQEALHDPTLSERPGCSAPPHSYNEANYEGLLRFAQVPRKLLVHAMLGELGVGGEGPRESTLLYETGS